jgi:hypothetical protein
MTMGAAGFHIEQQRADLLARIGDPAPARPRPANRAG